MTGLSQEPSKYSKFFQGLKPSKTAGLEEMKGSGYHLSDFQMEELSKFGALPQTTQEGTQEELARTQGALNKWQRGITKFVGKTLTAGAGGIASLFSLPAFLVTGDAKKFYDTDFQHWLDSLNEGMDENLANYYTAAESEKNFWQSLGTANFWANDVLGGASFIAGALVTEAVTGGIGTAAGLTKLGTKLGKALGKKGVKLTDKSTVKKVLKHLERGAFEVGDDLIKGTRQMITGAGYESGVEARHASNDIEKSLIEQYVQENGKEPDQEEYAKIKSLANQTGNGVFGLNLALISRMNAVTLPKTFGRGAGKLIEDYAGGIAHVDDLTKKQLKRIGPTTQKFVDVSKASNPVKNYLKKAYKFLEKPVSEGLIEEGGQSLIGEGGMQFALGAYDPENTIRSYDLFEALGQVLSNSFAAAPDKFGDKEFWKEVGIGAILGGAGAPHLNLTKYNQTKDVKDLFSWQGGVFDAFTDPQAERREQIINTLNSTSVGENMHEFLKAAIRQDKINEDYDEATAIGDMASMKNKEFDSLFNMSVAYIKAGRTKELKTQISEQVKQMDLEAFAKEFGYKDLSQEELQARKDKVIASFDKQVNYIIDSYAKAKQARLYENPDLVDALAYEIASVRNIDEREFDLTQQLSQYQFVKGQDTVPQITLIHALINEGMVNVKHMSKQAAKASGQMKAAISRERNKQKRVEELNKDIELSEKNLKEIEKNLDSILSEIENFEAVENTDADFNEYERKLKVKKKERDKVQKQYDRLKNTTERKKQEEFEALGAAKKAKTEVDNLKKDLKNIIDINEVKYDKTNFDELVENFASFTLENVPEIEKNEVSKKFSDLGTLQQRRKNLIDLYNFKKTDEGQRDFLEAMADMKDRLVSQHNLTKDYLERAFVASQEPSTLSEWQDRLLQATQIATEQETKTEQKDYKDIDVNAIRDQYLKEKEASDNPEEVIKKYIKEYKDKEEFEEFVNDLETLLKDLKNKEEVKGSKPKKRIMYNYKDLTKVLFIEDENSSAEEKHDLFSKLNSNIIHNSLNLKLVDYPDSADSNGDPVRKTQERGYVDLIGVRDKPGKGIGVFIENEVGEDVLIGYLKDPKSYETIEGKELTGDDPDFFNPKWTEVQKKQFKQTYDALVDILEPLRTGKRKKITNKQLRGAGFTFSNAYAARAEADFSMDQLTEENYLDNFEGFALVQNVKDNKRFFITNGKKIREVVEPSEIERLEDIESKLKNKPHKKQVYYALAKSGPYNVFLAAYQNSPMSEEYFNQKLNKAFDDLEDSLHTLEKEVEKDDSIDFTDALSPEERTINLFGGKGLDFFAGNNNGYFQSIRLGVRRAKEEENFFDTKLGKPHIKLLVQVSKISQKTGEYFNRDIPGVEIIREDSKLYIVTDNGNLEFTAKNFTKLFNKRMPKELLFQRQGNKYNFEFKYPIKGYSNEDKVEDMLETNIVFSPALGLNIIPKIDKFTPKKKKKEEEKDDDWDFDVPYVDEKDTSKGKKKKKKKKKKKGSGSSFGTNVNAEDTNLEGLSDDDEGDSTRGELGEDEEMFFKSGVVSEKETYDQAVENLQEILPQVDVKVLETLANKAIQGETILGMTIRGAIYLNKNAPKGTEYHEAFHVVYRSILSDSEQARIMAAAKRKYSKPTKEELDRLEAIIKAYEMDMNPEELYYEEKLADDFMDYKNSQKPTKDNIITRLFKKILNFIRSLRNPEITNLFEQIESGAFAGSTLKRQFKSPAFVSMPTDHAKVSVIGKNGKKEKRAAYIKFLNQDDVNMIINTLVMNKLQGKEYEEVLQELKDKTSEIPEDAPERYQDIAYALKYLKNRISKDRTVQESIIEEADKRLEIFKEIVEEDEEKEERYNIAWAEKGGLKSFNQEMKLFIAQIPMRDKFGDYIDFDFAADASRIFGGVIRYLSNTRPENMLPKLAQYAKINTNAKYFYEYLVDEIRKEQRNRNIDRFEDTNLYNKFIASFRTVYVPTMETLMDPANDKRQLTHSNLASVVVSQIEQWAALEPNLVDKRTALRQIKEKIFNVETEQDALDKAKEIRELFASINMPISEGYSIMLTLENLDPLELNEYKDLYQLSISNTPTLTEKEWIEFIAKPLASKKQSKSIYRKLSFGNMMLDEEVGSASFTNMEQKLVYEFLTPNYYSEEIHSWIEDMKENGPPRSPEELKHRLRLRNTHLDDWQLEVYWNAIQDNPLFDDTALQAAQLYLNGGVRQANLVHKKGRSNPGKTFTHLDPRTKILQPMYMFNPNHNRKDLKNKDQHFYLSLGVMAEKSTNFLLKLPMQDKKWFTSDPTKDAINFAYALYKGEQDRIKREKKAIKEGTATLIVGYNAKMEKGELVPDPEGRAFKSSNFEWVGSSKNPAEAKAKLKKGLDNLVDDFIELLRDEDIIDENDKSSILPTPFVKSEKNKKDSKNKNLPISRSQIGEYVMYDFLYTLAFNNLLDGDMALQFKDPIDYVKRNSGKVAAGPSLFNGRINPNTGEGIVNVAIIEDVEMLEELDKEVANNTPKAIERTDAQSYATVRFMRDIFNKSRGKATDSVNKILDKVEMGISISDIENNKLVAHQADLRPRKLVQRDRFSYIKTSTVALTREFVADRVVSEEQVMRVYNNLMKKYKAGEGVYPTVHPHFQAMFKAKPGREKGFKLLQEMETKNIDFVAYKSASKTITRKLSKSDNLESFPLNLNTFREQLITDSNKMVGANPTQALGLIESEQKDNTKVKINGKEKSVKDIKKRTKELIELRTSKAFNIIEHTIFNIENGKIVSNNYNELHKLFSKRLADDPWLTELFSLEGNSPKYSWNLPVIQKKFQQIYYSIISKPLYPTVPRKKFSLMSDDLFRVGKERLKFGLEKDGVYYAEAAISRSVLMKMGWDGKSKLPDSLKYMFGVRIPTQDKHSMVNLKIVEVLPSYMGPAIIMPPEIIALSGADFDIDSLFVRYKQHNKQGKPFGSYTTYGEAVLEIDAQFKGSEDDVINELKKQVGEKIKHKENFKRALGKLSKAMVDSSSPTQVLQDLSFVDDILDFTRENQAYTVAQEHLDFILNSINWDNLYTQMIRNLGELKKESDEAKDLILKEIKEIKSEITSLKEILKKYRNRKIVELQNKGLVPKYFRKIVAENIKNRKEGKNSTPLTVAEINNELVDNFLALSHNKGNKKEARTPATMKKHINAADKIGRDEREIYSVHSPIAKAILSKSIDIGEANIGPAALFNIAYQRLQGLKTVNTINGNDRYLKYTGPDGRINDIISENISAMTDNVKVQLASVFNMTADSVNPFLIMIATGTPFDDAVQIMIDPEVKKYIFKKLRRKSAVQLSEERTSLKEYFDNIDKEASDELKIFQAAEKEAEHVFRFTKIIGMGKGFSPTIQENLNRMESLSHFEIKWNDKDTFDSLNIFFPKKHPYKEALQSQEHKIKAFILGQKHSANYMLASKLTNDIKRAKAAIGDRLDISKFIDGYISFISAKRLFSNQYKDIITPGKLLFNPKFKAKVKAAQREMPENKFLQYLKIEDKPRPFGLGTNLNVITTDSRMKYDPSTAANLTNSFMDLYLNPKTRKLSQELMYYLLYKDGLEFKNGSFARNISAFMYATPSQAVEDIHSEKFTDWDFNEYLELYATNRDNLSQLEYVDAEESTVTIEERASYPTYLKGNAPDNKNTILYKRKGKKQYKKIKARGNYMFSGYSLGLKKTDEALTGMIKMSVSSSTSKIAKQDATKLLDMLKKKFNVPYEFFNDPDKSPGYYAYGKVYINEARMGLDTPFHEYSHPFIQAVRKRNPLLYKNLKKEAIAHPIYKDILKDYAEVYKDPESFVEEAIVTLLGIYATKPQTLTEKLRVLIEKFMNSVKKMLKIGEIDPKMTIRELAFLIQNPDGHIDLEQDVFNSAQEAIEHGIKNKMNFQLIESIGKFELVENSFEFNIDNPIYKQCD